MTILIHCLAAFFGCLGFSFIFRIFKNIHFALIGSVLGALGYFIYTNLVFTDNVYLQTFIGMLAVSLLSEMFARMLKAPATIFIIIGCFPLVPGSGIYNTMLQVYKRIKNHEYEKSE